MSSDPLINSSAYSPPSEEHNRKKRIRIRRIIIAVGLTLIGLTLLQNYFIQQETSSPIANNVTVVALFNVIIILIFVLLLLITRNLVKLYNERKSKIIGSKFQVKLIIAFLILALVPSILLFIVAGKLFNYSIEKWFSLQVRE
ncbi:MAG: PAS domain-containing sensor histidine kinase, partial [Nitrospinales bacterium]